VVGLVSATETKCLRLKGGRMVREACGELRVGRADTNIAGIMGGSGRCRRERLLLRPRQRRTRERCGEGAARCPRLLRL
jgi:hypothetical protein